MAQQRIKGQEISILIVKDSVLVSELTDIQNFGIELDVELLQQGYLGEKSDRYDEIYKGCKFDFEMHEHSQDVLTFQSNILARAKRDTPDVVINIVVTLNFPNGQTPTVTLPDCHFGAMPRNVGSRSDYSKIKFQGAVSDPDIETS